ncbi:DUF6193 family natural product biosynthesis protein [Streptomyces sp. NPDC002588]|uniref:DUF6193 family natural product biosynthesis protein n=1 Tax=Streptomyces sp. NPDC002588 TaxID=3154419 RepID=UPI00331EC029
MNTENSTPARHRSLPPKPELPDLAAAHLRGPAEAVDVRWRQLLLVWQWHRDRQEILRPGAPYPGVVPLLEAAAAHPLTRRLYPFTSHFTLCLGSRTRYPYDVRAPAVTPMSDGRFRVHRLRVAAPIGHTDTAEEAVALVAAHLPDGLGPATAG